MWIVLNDKSDNSNDAVDNRLEAERIIKWVFENKKQIINKVRYTFKKCKKNITVALQRCQLTHKTNLICYVDALCGKSMHTHNSLPFFSEIGFEKKK